MQADILDKIVAGRRARLGAEGSSQGLDLPAERAADLPIVPFPAPVICEIKRRSPSRGTLAANLDPVAQARVYRDNGARAVSVLTEQDHFDGALADLVSVKRAFPDLAVLRKDFLLSEEDIDVAWRAGADAVLLIAAILSTEELASLHDAAARRGLAALVEIHDSEDLERIRPVRPALVGINSRDLRTFRVDMLAPLALSRQIDWPCTTVFESGIFHAEDALLARDGGFAAVLVGEAVVREPARIGALVTALGADASGAVDPVGASVAQRLPFWTHVALRRGALAPGRPLVKICGITCREDAELARDLGADMLGLVYADSPRRAPEGLAAELARDIGIPLVAVVVEPADLDHGLPNVDTFSSTFGYSGSRGEVEAPAGSLGTPETPPPATAAPMATTATPISTPPPPPSPPPASATDRESINLAAFRRAQQDLAAGHLDALQLHGAADPEMALRAGWPYLKAVRPATEQEARQYVRESRSARLLVDAFHPTQPGGTGNTVTEDVLQAVITTTAERPHGAVWLAGGLHAGTVGAAIERARPELIDASSRLEREPGRKDPEHLRAFFHAINTAAASLSSKE